MRINKFAIVLVIGLVSSLIIPEAVDAQGRSKKGVISAIKKKLRKLGPNRNRRNVARVDQAMMQDTLNVVTNGGQPRFYQNLKNRSNDLQASPRDRNTAKQALNRAKSMLATAFLEQSRNVSADQLARELAAGKPNWTNRVAFLRRELGPNALTDSNARRAQRLVAAGHVKALIDSGTNVLSHVADGRLAPNELAAAERYYQKENSPQQNTMRVLQGKAQQLTNMQRLMGLGTNGAEGWANALARDLASGNPATKLNALEGIGTFSKAAEGIPPGFREGNYARDILRLLNDRLPPDARLPAFKVPPGVSVNQAVAANQPNYGPAPPLAAQDRSSPYGQLSLNPSSSYGQLSLIPASPYGILQIGPPQIPARGSVYGALPQEAREAHDANIGRQPPPVVRNQYVAAPAQARNQP